MTEGALTLSELQQRVTDIIDDNETTIMASVTRWFNDCQYKVCTNKRLGFLRATPTTITVSATTYQGSLPSGFDVEEVVYDSTHNNYLTYKEPRVIIQGDPDASQSTTGAPQHYFFPNSSTIQVWEVPTTALTLNLSYFSLPTVFSAPTDTGSLPPEFRARILVPYAGFKYFQFDDDKRANMLYSEYRDGVYELYDKWLGIRPGEDIGIIIGDGASNRPELSARG